MTTKAKAAIIGPGNIGTDLLMKCQRSDFIEATWMVGIEDSAGIQRARALGLPLGVIVLARGGGRFLLGDLPGGHIREHAREGRGS